MCLGKSVLKIGSKFIGEHPCRSVILIKMQSNFIEITLRHGCSPVNLLHVFRAPFSKNTSGWLLLKVDFHVRDWSLMERFKVVFRKMDTFQDRMIE